MLSFSFQQKYFDSGDYNMARAKVAPTPMNNPAVIGGAKKPAPPTADRMQLLQVNIKFNSAKDIELQF